MINTQLVDYIKLQLSQGVSKGKIAADLMVGGEWVPGDIEEAFWFIDKQNILVVSTSQIKTVEISLKKGKKKLILFILKNTSLFILAGCISFYFSQEYGFGFENLNQGFSLYGLVGTIPLALLIYSNFLIFKKILKKYGVLYGCLSMLVIDIILFLIFFSIISYYALVLPPVFLMAFLLLAFDFLVKKYVQRETFYILITGAVCLVFSSYFFYTNFPCYKYDTKCLSAKAISNDSISVCKRGGSSWYVSNCIKNFAIAKNDISICDNVLNTILKERCSLDYIYQIAVIKENISLCDSLQDSRNCYQNYKTTMIREGKIIITQDLCDSLKDGKIDCYSKLAQQSGDYSICLDKNKVDSQYQIGAKDRCLANVCTTLFNSKKYDQYNKCHEEQLK